MQNNSYDELIDQDTLQRLQDEFCRVAGVYAYCLDEEKECITGLSGGKGEETQSWSDGKIELMQSSQSVRNALERVEPGSLEDLAIEEFPDGDGRVAAIAVRNGEDTILYWVVFELSGAQDTHFVQVLDLLRDASNMFCAARNNSYNTAIRDSHNRHAEEEMSKTLQRVEATTDIVGLLDSDGRPEIVVDKWLRTLGHYLQVEYAEVFQLNNDGHTMDVFSQWCGRGKKPVFEQTEGLQRWDLLKTDKPRVISTGRIPGEFAWEMKHWGLSAIMVFPLIDQLNGGSLVFSAVYREEPHNWDVAEVKFASDAAKIMQSFLTRRMQKDYLSASNRVLETTLDIVDCAIYVKDKKGDRVLFANQKLKDTFEKDLKSKTFDNFVKRGEQKGKEGEAFELFHEKDVRWYEMTYKEIYWVDGTEATLYSLYDVTNRKLDQRKVERQAYTDELTGLRNRACCEKDLAGYMEEARKNHTSGAIIYLDLDGFERINDGLGYEYGDALLKEVARAMQRMESVGDSCYRIGGDEFVIIVPPNVYGRLDAIQTEVKTAFESPWFLKNADYYCTSSIGVTTFSGREESVETLLQRVESAMYEAKLTGKNRVVKYGEETT